MSITPPTWPTLLVIIVCDNAPPWTLSIVILITLEAKSSSSRPHRLESRVRKGMQGLRKLPRRARNGKKAVRWGHCVSRDCRLLRQRWPVRALQNGHRLPRLAESLHRVQGAQWAVTTLRNATRILGALRQQRYMVKCCFDSDALHKYIAIAHICMKNHEPHTKQRPWKMFIRNISPER